MARILLIESPLPPAEVFAALDARNRGWREADVPESLKQFGALGFRVTRKGSSFVLRVDRPQRDNIEWIDCKGTIIGTSTGCRIEARLRRTSQLWVILLLVWLIAGWQAARGGSALTILLTATLGTVLFVALLGIAYLTRTRQATIEHGIFEAILRRAAAGDTSPLASSDVAA
jgi:hypothetical protein